MQKIREFTVRDPFAGDIVVRGRNVDEAVALEYEDIPVEERPAYVWHGDTRVEVPR